MAAQGSHGHADARAVAEAVGDGARRVGDRDLDPLDAVVGHTHRQEFGRRPGQLQAGRAHPRNSVASRDGDPRSRRQLVGQPMEGERGEQADHTTWNPGRDQGQGVVGGDLGIREHGETPADVEEGALGDKAGENGSRDAERLEAAGAEHPAGVGRVEDVVGVGGRHGTRCQYLGRSDDVWYDKRRRRAVPFILLTPLPCYILGTTCR